MQNQSFRYLWFGQALARPWGHSLHCRARRHFIYSDRINLYCRTIAVFKYNGAVFEWYFCTTSYQSLPTAIYIVLLSTMENKRAISFRPPCSLQFLGSTDAHFFRH